jgi:molybdenum cofactor cytidylyltransferase
VDHPLVTEEDVLRVAESLERGAPIAIAAHGGRRGHPIGIGLEVMNEVVGDSSLRTLRDVVHKDPSRVVEVAASQGAVLGVNTKEDLDRVSNGTFR